MEKKGSRKVTKIENYTNNTSQNTESKHLAYIKGPILFTAPHSCNLYRGGPEYGIEETIHSKERFTSTLAIRWARQSDNSFCVWSNENKLNRKDVDPNYMQDIKKPFSPFHQSLHSLQLKNKDLPLMHVDIHGKKNGKKTFSLDLGIASLLVKWEKTDPEFCDSFREILTDNLNKALLLAKPFNTFKPICNNDPYLNGYWGCDNLYTMTEQAVDLGIPSLQLEIPQEMRKQLFINKSLSDAFLNAITDCYERVVKVWWPIRKINQICDIKIASKLIEMEKKDYENMLKEYENWDSVIKKKEK